MNVRIFAAGVLALANAAAAVAQTPGAAVDQLAWLSGCWQRAHPDGRTEEHWMAPLGGTMLGMSRTVRGGSTREYEFLQVREVDGALAYIARPSGQAEATFRVKTIAAGEVVFEDPAHDFPQRIIYRRGSEATLTARIEGTMNGQARGVDFPYTRCQ